MAFKLSSERCEEIKKIVVDVFERNCIHCVPISGFEIAAKIGAVVVPYSSKDESTRQMMMAESEDGFSVKYNGVWYIFYNDKKRYGRINNTLTHECGHIVMDHSEESELAETEAKFFAKYALAPPPLIKKFDLKTAEEIADAFDISYQAAEYALSYYHKWLDYGASTYTEYELKLLSLFDQTA